LHQWVESTVARISPGGALIITTPCEENLEHNMAYCPISDTLFHRWQHQRAFSPSALVELLGRHGVDPIVVHQVEFDGRVFGENGERSSLPELRRLIDSGRSLRIGYGSTIVYVGQKRVSTCASTDGNDWTSQLAINAVTELRYTAFEGYELFTKFREGITSKEIALVLPRLPYEPVALQLDDAECGAAVILQPVQDPRQVGPIGMRRYGYNETLGRYLRFARMPTVAFVVGRADECGAALKRAMFEAGVTQIYYAEPKGMSADISRPALPPLKYRVARLFREFVTRSQAGWF
jgi:hypothetical protein